MRERGGVPLAMVIFMVVIVLLMVGLATTCDALWDDRDEEGDLGVVVVPALSGSY